MNQALNMTQATRNLSHPVWNIYDLIRTTRLNVLYYDAKLQRAEKTMTAMQMVLAAAVPSSAIAGFEVWQFGLGTLAWKLFASFSAFVAFIQPFLGLPKKTKRYSELLDGYKILYFDLKDIQEKIEEDKEYNNAHKKLFKAAKDRRKKLEIKETGFWVSKKLRAKCQKQVNRDFPAQSFFIPEEDK